MESFKNEQPPSPQEAQETVEVRFEGVPDQLLACAAELHMAESQEMTELRLTPSSDKAQDGIDARTYHDLAFSVIAALEDETMRHEVGIGVMIADLSFKVSRNETELYVDELKDILDILENEQINYDIYSALLKLQV